MISFLSHFTDEETEAWKSHNGQGLKLGQSPEVKFLTTAFHFEVVFMSMMGPGSTKDKFLLPLKQKQVEAPNNFYVAAQYGALLCARCHAKALHALSL